MGAGMGVDSGLPDFRGTEGFWKSYPAFGREQVDVHAIASPVAFRDRPQRAWGFYGHRLEFYRQTQPHAGFEMLKRWGKKMSQGYAVFTSNVDGQFQKAGCNPGVIHECHGSIHHLQCLNACIPAIWPAPMDSSQKSTWLSADCSVRCRGACPAAGWRSPIF